MKMLRKLLPLLLCARRPLTLSELAEAYAIDQTSDRLDVRKIPTDIGRILRAFSHLVVYEKRDTTVRFAHQTVKQYFLDISVDRHPDLVLTQETAQQELAELCVTYLMLSDFETQIAQVHTVATEIKPTLVDGILWNRNPLARTVFNTVSRIFMRQAPVTQTSNALQLKTQVIPRPSDPISASLRTKYSLLEYMVTYWASHAANLSHKSIIWPKFRKLCFERQMLVEFRPWKYVSTTTPIKTSGEDEMIARYIDWSLRNNAVAFLDLALEQYRSRVTNFLEIYATLPILIYPRPSLQDIKDQRQSVLEESENPLAYVCAARHYEVLERLANHLETIELPEGLQLLLMIAEAETSLQLTSVAAGLRSDPMASVSALRYTLFESNSCAVEHLLRRQINIMTDYEDTVNILLEWIEDVELPASSLHLDCFRAFQKFFHLGVEKASAALEILADKNSCPLLSILLDFPEFHDNNSTVISSAVSQAMSRAVAHRHFGVVEVLLNKHVYKLGVSSWSSGLINSLLRKGFQITDQTISYMIPDPERLGLLLMLAAKSGDCRTIQRLLEHPTPISHELRAELTAVAISSSKDAVALQLLKSFATVDVRLRRDNSALHLASFHGRIRVVVWLVRRGANVNLFSEMLSTPLVAAAHNGHAEVAELLIEHGADVHAQIEEPSLAEVCMGRKYTSVFNLAIGRGHLEFAAVLLEHGAEPGLVAFGRSELRQKLLNIRDPIKREWIFQTLSKSFGTLTGDNAEPSDMQG